MNTSLARWMAMVGCYLATAQGCAHIDRAKYDPCARKAERRNSDAGPRIISCRLFYIPFRAEVVDANTGGPIATAVALDCTNLLGEAADDGPVAAMSTDSGLIEGEVDTFTDVASPWNNECFRSTFRGILIEIRKECYVPFRGYVPLPAAEGDVADLGLIRLESKQE